MVLSFKYLGRLISAADDDWLEMIQNLAKAWTVWMRMSRILSREGARPRVSGFFFKAIVQSVLLFSADKWVVTPLFGEETGLVTPCMGQVLGNFQYHVAQLLIGWIPQRRLDERWEYTLV